MEILLRKVIAGFRLSNEARGLSKKTIQWYDSNFKPIQSLDRRENRQGYDVNRHNVSGHS